MATPLSEVITYLNFDGVIPTAEEHETIKVLLQEFGSMSVTVVSDQNLNFLIEFSNDGKNFDYTNSSSIPEGENQTITSVILGKWCRMRALNASNVSATVRFTTYCQVLPIASQSQIEAEGNNFPTFNVDNLSSTLYNEMRVSERRPEHQHNFTYTSDNDFGVLSGPDRELVQTSGNGFDPLVSPATIVGNTLTLSNIYSSPAGSYQCVYGPPVVVNYGNPVYVNFSSGFNISGYVDGFTLGFDQMLVGMGWVDITSGDIIDGFYIGYPSFPNPPATIVDEISFVIFTRGVERHVVKSKWSDDRLDGNGPSSVLLDASNLSTWRIRTAVVNSVYLEYHNPTDNLWIPCHRIQFENLFSSTEISNPSYAFNIYTKRTSTATGLAVANGCGPASAQGVLGIEVGQKTLGRVDTYSVETPLLIIAQAVETEVFSVRAGEVINNIDNRSVLVPTTLFIFVKKDPPTGLATGETQGVFIKIYKNGTFVAPTWVYNDAVHDPLQIDTGKATVGTGFKIAGILNNAGLVREFDMVKYNSRISRSDTLTFTVLSTLSDVSVLMALNYELIT